MEETMILLDEQITSDHIKCIRKQIKEDTVQIRKHLGVTIGSLVNDLPIRIRKFSIWVYIQDKQIAGAITFEQNGEGRIFIKLLYVFPEFRDQGIGKQLLNSLIKMYEKIECKINDGNIAMYKLASSCGLKGERKRLPITLNNNSTPIWWSNYLTSDSYITANL